MIQEATEDKVSASRKGEKMAKVKTDVKSENSNSYVMILCSGIEKNDE